MEWLYDVFRVMSLVIVWAIPAILVAAVAVFVVAAPALTVGGMICRVHGTVSAILQKKTQAEKQRLGLVVCSTDVDCPPGFVCAAGHCVPQKGAGLARA